MVHEFAHGIHLISLMTADKTFEYVMGILHITCYITNIHVLYVTYIMFQHMFINWNEFWYLTFKLSNRLVSAYRTAMSQGKWRNTYAATDEKEYWAIGVQGMIWYVGDKRW